MDSDENHVGVSAEMRNRWQTDRTVGIRQSEVILCCVAKSLQIDDSQRSVCHRHVPLCFEGTREASWVGGMLQDAILGLQNAGSMSGMVGVLLQTFCVVGTNCLIFVTKWVFGTACWVSDI